MDFSIFDPSPHLSPWGVGGMIFFYSMCFYLNFLKKSTFLRLVDNFLIYKGFKRMSGLTTHFGVEIWLLLGVFDPPL